jgi:hypothetical protein
MDKELINKLILVGSVAGAILVMYFIMSPYQNCMKTNVVQAYNSNLLLSDDKKATWCITNTSW